METVQGIDRRRHLRVGLSRCHAVLLHDEKDLGLCVVRDVSRSGAFIEHPTPCLPFRSAVQLRFPAGDAGPELTLAGEIVHVVSAEQSDGTPGYGVQFVKPPTDAVERVSAKRSPRAVDDTSPPKPGSVRPPRRDVPAEPASVPDVLLSTSDPGFAHPILRAFGLFGIFATKLQTLEAISAAIQRDGSGIKVLVLHAENETEVERWIGEARCLSRSLEIWVVASALPDSDTRARWHKSGARRLILQPVDPLDLCGQIGRAVRARPN